MRFGLVWFILCFVVFCLLGAINGGLAAPAPQQNVGKIGNGQAAQAIQGLPGKWYVHVDSDESNIRKIRIARTSSQTGLQPASLNQSLSINDFAERTAGLFGFKEHGDRLEQIQLRNTPGGSHATYRQTWKGIPLNNTSYKVHANKDGQVCAAERWGPSFTIAPAEEAVLSASDAIEIVKQRHGILSQRGESQASLSIRVFDKSSRYVWVVIIPSLEPLASYYEVVDAINGSIWESCDLLLRMEGTARVFDPNPIVVTGDTTLRDENDDFMAVPARAYIDMTLDEIDDSGYLNGPYVYTSDPDFPDGPYSSSGDFVYNRSDSNFEFSMCYFHLDRTSRYLASLGYGDIVSQPVRVMPRGISEDSSFYDPAMVRIVFGTGGVDDAEDADIINHEFGHYIQDRQIKNFGTTVSSRSIGEGFSDYWAASRRVGTNYPTLIGMWDATSYSDTDPPYLRRVDTDKCYPDDLVYEVHADGEIWSAVLYEILENVGRDNANRIILESHEFLPQDANFFDAAEALFLGDDLVNKGANHKVIYQALYNHGLAGVLGTGAHQFAVPGEAVLLSVSASLNGIDYHINWQQIDGPDVDLQVDDLGAAQFVVPQGSMGEIFTFEFEFEPDVGGPPLSDVVHVFVLEHTTKQISSTIPDGANQGIRSVIEVTETNPLTGIVLYFKLDHPSGDDLEVELTSPLGTKAYFYPQTGAFTSIINFADFSTFDCANSENLLPFLAENPSGLWSLVIRDETPGNRGEWIEWTIAPLTETEPSMAVDTSEHTIPDNGTAYLNLEVSTGGLIQELHVFLDITHSYIGDLEIDLSSPDGSTVRLHNREGESQDYLTAVYAPDDAGTKQLEDLEVFAGKFASGVWRLKIADKVKTDTGQVNAWGLSIKMAPTDVNEDGSTDLDDVVVLRDSSHGAKDSAYDYNRDGYVDRDDAVLLFQYILSGK